MRRLATVRQSGSNKTQAFRFLAALPLLAGSLAPASAHADPTPEVLASMAPGEIARIHAHAIADIIAKNAAPTAGALPGETWPFRIDVEFGGKKYSAILWHPAGAEEVTDSDQLVFNFTISTKPDGTRRTLVLKDDNLDGNPDGCYIVLRYPTSNGDIISDGQLYRDIPEFGNPLCKPFEPRKDVLPPHSYAVRAFSKLLSHMRWVLEQVVSPTPLPITKDGE